MVASPATSEADGGSEQRRLFVTGGAGLLGSALVPMAKAAGWMVEAPSSTELDIRDRTAVEAAFGRWGEGRVGGQDDGTCRLGSGAALAIAHLAYRRDEGDTIVDGSVNIARAAAHLGARLVHLSTDALFAGRDEPYTEADEPDPVHDYGRWKTAAEQEVGARCPTAVIVRTSLMYRGDGTAPCEVDVGRVLDGASPMRFFTDEVRCFSHVADVAAAVLRLSEPADARCWSVHGPLNVAASEPVDRATFARLVAARAGRDPSAVPTSTIVASGLDRPGRVVLDVGRAARRGIICRSASSVLAAP